MNQYNNPRIQHCSARHPDPVKNKVTCSLPSGHVGQHEVHTVIGTLMFSWYSESKATEPREWWVIHGADLMAALKRAHEGDKPEVVYLELIANSENREVQ